MHNAFPHVVPAALDAEELRRQARFMWELAPQLSKQVHAEHLEEEATKLASSKEGGHPDPSMPGFTTMFWRRLMATPMVPPTCQIGRSWRSWHW